MKAVIFIVVISASYNLLVQTDNNQDAKTKRNSYQIKEKAETKLRLPEPNLIETVNQLAASIIDKLPVLMQNKNLNPFLAPNISQYIMPVNLKLTHIKVYNLTSIRMASNLEMLDDQTNRKLIASLKLTFDDIVLISNYRAYIKLPVLPAVGSKGILRATVPGVTVDVKATIDFKNVNVELNTLKLTSDRSLMKVRLSGNLESYVINAAMPAILMILQRVILQIIEAPLRKEINKILAEITGMVKLFFGNVD